MSTSLGSLVVELSANMAQFQSDMGKAAHIAQQNMEKINHAAEIAKKGLATLGIGLGVKEFAEMVKGTLEAADQLGKMSQKVGISVESLSALRYSAELSDVSLEQLGIGLTKLSKNMLLAEQSSAKLINSTGALGSIPVGAAAAFHQMNIDVEASKGHLKSSEQVFMEVADQFSHMHDGALKTGLAMQIFGKSGAQMIPLLNEGGAAIKAQREEAERLGIVISENMSKAAEEFNDNMRIMNFRIDGLKTGIASTLLPTLNEFSSILAENSLEARNSGDSFSFMKTILETLIIVGANVKYTFTEVGVEIGGIAAQIAALAHGDMKGFHAISDAMKEDGIRARKELDTFEQRILHPGMHQTVAQMLAEQNRGLTDGADPGLRLPGKKTSQDNTVKNLLANNLKIQEALVSREADILSSRNKFIDQYNSDNLLSIKDYYAAKKAAQDENVTATLALYDKEIADLKAYSAKAAKATDRADATSKINDLLAKKAKLEQSAAESGIIGGMQEAKAFKDLANQIGSVNAQVLDLTGHLHAAAVIRFDQQNDALRKRFMAENNIDALAAIDTMKEQTLAQVDLNKITQDATLIKAAAANAEMRINITQKAGAMSELGTLQSLSAVRMKEADQLQGLYDQYKAIADASGTPKMIQDADDMKVALESLRAESDLVAQKFETIFTDSFSSAFTEFASGAKSASDAFKSFAQSVGAEISKLAAQKLSEQLFGNMFQSQGSGGSTGWIGSALSLLGGAFGGGATTSGGMAASQTAGFSAADLASWGGASFAVGTDYVPHDMLAKIHQGERIVPASQNNGRSDTQKSGDTYNITVHVTGSNNAPDVRRSAGQGAREALSALNEAKRYA